MSPSSLPSTASTSSQSIYQGSVETANQMKQMALEMRNLTNDYKEIRAQNRTIIAGVQKLISLVNANNSKVTKELPEGFPIVIPCASLLDVVALERWLTERETRRSFVAYLQSSAGFNAKMTTFEILRKVIGKNCGKLLNWKGGNNKTGLSNAYPALLKVIRSEYKKNL